MPESLDLVVNVRYYGTKARDFYEGSRKAMDILREDLIALKLPHPKREKTLIRSLPDGKGECSFMWPAVPTRSVLHRNLSTRIYDKETEGARRSLLRELSICRLSLRESPSGTVSLDSRNATWRTWGGAQAEAQVLLDNMALTLKVPKNEPIEPTLPDASSTRASPRAQDRYFVESSMPVTSPAVAPSISDVPSSYANRQYDNSMLSSKRTTLTRPIKILPESPVIPSPSLYNENSDPVPPGLTFAARSSDRISNSTMRSPATSRKRSRSSSPLDFRPRRPPPDPSHLSNTNGDTSRTIESLKFELQFVRGQIAGNLGHEASIISQLDALGHTASLRETPQEIALREKLQALELQLQAETRMRIEAENALKDFKMECRKPFLVPVLYDVVESVSRLTTEVVGRIQQEAGEGI